MCDDDFVATGFIIGVTAAVLIVLKILNFL